MSVLQAVIYGFFWGFLLCFTLGPAFFGIIQASIDAGFRKGIIMSAGVIFSDLALVFFAAFGTAFIPYSGVLEKYLPILGPTILLFLGLYSIFSANNRPKYPQSTLGNILYFFTKGALLNLANPANIAFFVATIAYLRIAQNFGNQLITLFFLSSFLATFLAQVLIASYAFKLKSYFTATKMTWFNRAVGGIFIVLALIMLAKLTL